MILPVIDVQQGLVVRGIAGRRSEYQPLQSRLASEPTPISVARAFEHGFNARDVYVADLDAIGGAEPDWKSLDEIGQAGLAIWLDCGIREVSSARHLLERPQFTQNLAAVVVGLESIPSPNVLASVFDVIGPESAVFSLDLREGRPNTNALAWQGLDPLRIAFLAHEIGFRRQIVLDLASVGLEQGPSVLPLCRELRTALGRMELTAGGGVRHLGDVALLETPGSDRVLVASALHNGAIPARANRAV